jgi:hypothetical protein
MPALFKDIPIELHFKKQYKIIDDAVNQADEKQLYGPEAEIVINNLADKFSKKASIKLIELHDKMEYDNPMVYISKQLKRPTAHVTYRIPYSGNKDLLFVQPKSFSPDDTREVAILDDQIVFDIDSGYANENISDAYAKKVVQEAKAVKAFINQILPFVIQECKEFNESLEEYAKAKLLAKGKVYKEKMDMRDKLDPNK